MLTEKRAALPLNVPQWINRIVVPILRGAWLTATDYKAYDAVVNDGSSYIARLAHTSGPTTEPGTGGSWQTVWMLWAEGGDDVVPEPRLLVLEARQRIVTFPFIFDDVTTIAAPATGNFRLNNATLASVTKAAVHGTDIDGIDRLAAMRSWERYTAGETQGRLLFKQTALQHRWAEYLLKDIIDHTTWLELDLVLVPGQAANTLQDASETILSFRSSSDRDIEGHETRIDIIESADFAAITPVEVVDSKHELAVMQDDLKVMGTRFDGSLDVGPVNHAPQLHRGYTRLAPNGAILVGRDRSGSGIFAKNYQAWVEDGNAWFRVFGRKVQMTDILSGGSGSNPVINCGVNELYAWILFEDGEWVDCDLSGYYPRLPGNIDTIMLVDGYGQSNWRGNSSSSVLTPEPFSNRALMFKWGMAPFGRALGHDQDRTNPQAPWKEAILDYDLAHEEGVGGAGESPMSNFIKQMLAGVPANVAIVGTNSAIGSASMQMLFKNATELTGIINNMGQPFVNRQLKFRRNVMFWRLQGYKVVAGPTGFNLGESHIGSAEATFKGWLNTIRSDWQTEVDLWNAGIDFIGAGYDGNALLVTTQTANGNKYTFPSSEVPWAQLAINFDDPFLAVNGGAPYDQDYNATDEVHLLGPGQAMHGARAGVAAREWLEGNQFRPLSIRTDVGHTPVRVTNIITGEFWNYFNRTIDDANPDISGLGANCGVEYVDASSGVTATLFEVLSNTTWRLTLSGDPGGATGKRIKVAQNGVSSDAPGPVTGGRTSVITTGGSDVTLDGRAIEWPLAIQNITGIS